MRRIFLIALEIILGIPVLVLLVLYVNRASHQDDWKKRTTPLPPETVATLCTNFELDKDNRLCNQKKDVYGADFYSIIRDTFRPIDDELDSSKASTYDEVEKRLGSFKDECEPTVYQADGFAYFNCIYDLRGDGEFIIGIMYTYPGNAVLRINTPMGFDGE